MMKRILLCSLVGLALTNCSKSSPAPTLVGTWEKVSVRSVTVYKDGKATRDETEQMSPGSVLMEFTADGQLFFPRSSCISGCGAYSYSGGNLTFRYNTIGQSVHPVSELTEHRLVFHTYNESKDESTDNTLTWRR